MPEINETELIKEAKQRFKSASAASDDNFNEMISDLKFKEGDQWPDDLEARRTSEGRPCLKINKLAAFHDRIVGDQRNNRPAIKVHPVDDAGDPETAKVLNGLIRNIEVQSAADVAYDTAYDGASACGMGAFRIITEYSDDDTFDQDIKIKRIKNQFTVFVDPACQEADFSDAEYMFITEKLPRETYQREYPDKSTMQFEANRDADQGWVFADSVRVAEYFRKVKVKKTIYLVHVVGEQAPKVVDELPDVEYVELKSRVVDTHKIEWMKINGNEILEGPQEWSGRYIPIVIVTGKETNIENKTHYRGIIRHAKDPQRLYNYNRSQQAEVNALAPRAPFLVTPKQINAFRKQWDNQHEKSYPYLFYNADAKAPGPPQRQWPQPPSVGIQQEILLSDQELHDTTGLPLASMGERSNEKSGKAIQERRLQGDIGQIVYSDNLGRALRYAGKILVDLIPRIYDVPRVIRVIGEDESDDYVQINQEFTDEKDGKQKLFDLTTGKYDVTISTGPSYQTQRQEAVDSMTAFITAFPESAPMISDLLVKNMDWPGATEIAERLKKLVPPQLLQPEPEPGEEQPPDPQQMAMEQQQQEQAAAQAAILESEAKIKMMEAETAAIKLEQEKADLRKKQAEADTAELEAQIGADLA
jgi:hypothetical protein